MKTINSNAVRNEVMAMQQNNTEATVKSSGISKGTLLFIAYVTAAVGVLIALNSLGLIPNN